MLCALSLAASLTAFACDRPSIPTSPHSAIDMPGKHAAAERRSAGKIAALPDNLVSPSGMKLPMAACRHETKGRIRAVNCRQKQVVAGPDCPQGLSPPGNRPGMDMAPCNCGIGKSGRVGLQFAPARCVAGPRKERP